MSQDQVGIMCIVCYETSPISRRRYNSGNYGRCPHCLASDFGY